MLITKRMKRIITGSTECVGYTEFDKITKLNANNKLFIITSFSIIKNRCGECQVEVENYSE